MDSSFTEHVLERARERQKKLQESSNSAPLREANLILDRVSSSVSQPNLGEFKKPFRKEAVSDSNLSTKAMDSISKENQSEGRVQKIVRQNSSTKITSALPGSPQPQLKTLNIERDNFNMEIKLISSENVRVEVEIQESDNSEDEFTNGGGEEGVQIIETPGLREQAKNRLKKLGKLYAGGEDADISSPIQRTEARFLSEVLTPPDSASGSNIRSRKGLSKLADLAQNISQWEDNISRSKKEEKKDEDKAVTKKSWKHPAPQPPSLKNLRVKQRAPQPPESQPILSQGTGREVTPKQMKIVEEEVTPKHNKVTGEEVTPKQLKWDRAVLNSLESQGFTRTTSNTRLIYNYNSSHQETNSNPQDTIQETDETAFLKHNVPMNTVEEETTVAKKCQLVDGVQEVSQEQKKVTDDTVTAKKLVSLNVNLEQKKVAEGVPTLKETPKTIISAKEQQKTDDIIIAKKFVPLKVNLEQEKVTPRSPGGKPSARSVAIANRVAIFESSPTTTSNKDPAVMTMAEKKALFERNKGADAVTPQRFNATPKQAKANCPTPSSKPVFTVKPKEAPIGSPVKAALADSGGIASKIAALIKNKNTISQDQIQNNIREQRQKEMEVLMNRFNKNKNVAVKDDSEDETTPMLPPTKIVTAAEIVPSTQVQSVGEKRRSGEKRSKKSDSPQVAAVLEDVKRIKVTQPKDGRLYPSLSDIETATETEPERTVTPSLDNSREEESFCSEESGGADTSFGREILQAVCMNQTPQKRAIVYDEPSGSDVSDILDDMDDYLDEAMADEESDYSNGPTPPKVGRVTPPLSNLTRPSDSFHYKNFSPKINMKTPSPSKVRPSTDLPTHVIDGDDVLPLTHTVSFYRRQQSQVKTPVRQISRQAIVEEVGNEDDKIQSDEGEMVNKKIQELLDEVNRQQMIISQTSQALNLCNATPEFTGSTEQVEAEKVLLLATHRRQACLNEVQRLRVEKTLRPQGQHSQNLPLEKGALTLSNIILPLKKEYVRALAAAGGKGHHVVCLIKCGEQVHATHLVSTVATSSKNPDQELRIPGSVHLENIFSDFTVTFEVYCLQAQEEVLPHEVKYHINKKPGSKLTPKKAKQESRMIRPPRESPAGPNAVRTSTFALMGYVVFSIQALNKKHWTLNKAPSMSPLEGSIDMKVSCELAVSVKYKGFLTMFEDVSGFGAWHRRWCLLNGDTLSYWKYPDDEKKKAPIDSISLKSAITEKVGPVSRDICARLHTFLIERERKAEPEDKESLVLIRKGDKTIIRHLLSADTKEERIEWCSMFNKALTALRMWGNN